MSPRGTCTNLALQSDAMLAGWAQLNATNAAYGGPFPVGGPQAMTLFSDTAAAGFHGTYLVPAGLVSGEVVIASAFVKTTAGTGFACLYMNAGVVPIFNLSTGVVAQSGVGAGNILDAGIQDLGGGLFRVYIRGTYTGLALAGVAQSGTVANYANGGTVSTVAIGGMMIERPAPGQTTPSPYAPSGATAGVGRRETRQNLITQSIAHTLSPWANDGTCTTTANYAPDRLGRNIATRVQMIATATRYVYQANSFLIKSGTNTFAVWMRGTSGPATVRLRLPTVNGNTAPVYSSDIVLDTTWRRYLFTLANVGDGYTGGLAVVGIFNGSASPAADFLLGNVQLAQTNTMPDEIETTSAPANANGAPRSLVI